MNIMYTKFILPPIVSIVLNTVTINATFHHKIFRYVLKLSLPQDKILMSPYFLYICGR